MKCKNCGHETGQRTNSQNNALHLFCSQLAQRLNEMGLDMRAVLKPTYNLDWTTQSVKDHLWRNFQRLLFSKESTTELSKHEEIDKIHETLMREIGEKHKVEYIPFPDIHEVGGMCGKKSCPKCNAV